MSDMIRTRSRAPQLLRFLFPAIAICALLGTVAAVAASRGGPSFGDVRAATARYHDIDESIAAGYGVF